MERVTNVTWRGNLAMSDGCSTYRVVLDILDREVAQEVIYRLASCYGDVLGAESYAANMKEKRLSRYQQREASKYFLRARYILKGILDYKTMKVLGMREMDRETNSSLKKRRSTPRVSKRSITPVAEPSTCLADVEESSKLEGSIY